MLTRCKNWAMHVPTLTNRWTAKSLKNIKLYASRIYVGCNRFTERGRLGHRSTGRYRCLSTSLPLLYDRTLAKLLGWTTADTTLYCQSHWRHPLKNQTKEIVRRCDGSIIRIGLHVGPA